MNYLSQISLAPSAHIPHVPHGQATFDVGQGDEDRYSKKFSAEACGQLFTAITHK
jgi:hypothetical protein